MFSGLSVFVVELCDVCEFDGHDEKEGVVLFGHDEYDRGGVLFDFHDDFVGFDDAETIGQVLVVKGYVEVFAAVFDFHGAFEGADFVGA